MIKLSFFHPRDNCYTSSFIPRLFQKCIEALIDKQYIERREGSKDEYTYMAWRESWSITKLSNSLELVWISKGPILPPRIGPFMKNRDKD